MWSADVIIKEDKYQKIKSMSKEGLSYGCLVNDNYDDVLIKFVAL